MYPIRHTTPFTKARCVPYRAHDALYKSPCVPHWVHDGSCERSLVPDAIYKVYDVGTEKVTRQYIPGLD
ncbi:hypothetical protein J6590_090078 [Homalodisca vitripennis]|nr:hypothetical protein J6590_094684 [Homalodisca vitripennis]KAG8334452.1 hypothetical protein J6590_090078 [Homalodisca vitripennis]